MRSGRCDGVTERFEGARSLVGETPDGCSSLAPIPYFQGVEQRLFPTLLPIGEEFLSIEEEQEFLQCRPEAPAARREVQRVQIRSRLGTSSVDPCKFG